MAFNFFIFPQRGIKMDIQGKSHLTRVFRTGNFFIDSKLLLLSSSEAGKLTRNSFANLLGTRPDRRAKLFSRFFLLFLGQTCETDGRKRGS